MQNLPVVLATLNRPDLFMERSLQQSHITHNNPLSDAATLTLGLMVRHSITQGDCNACQLEADALTNQYKQFS